MPDLQNAVMFFGQPDQDFGFGQRGCNRFFNQDVYPLLQEPTGDLKMKNRGRGHHGQVNIARQRRMMFVRLAAMLLGERLRGLQVGVDNGGQLALVERLQQPGVDSPQMSAADNGDAQTLHAALLRSRPRPCRPSCCVCTKLSR